MYITQELAAYELYALPFTLQFAIRDDFLFSQGWFWLVLGTSCYNPHDTQTIASQTCSGT